MNSPGGASLRVFYVIEQEAPRAVVVLGAVSFFLYFDQVLYVAAEGLGDLV